MKKILLTLSLSISILLALIYVLLFTSFGNKILKPFVQEKINESSPVPVNLKFFSLRPSTLKLIFQFDDKNDITVEGAYELFSQNFNLDYIISLSDLKSFSKLSNKNLSGKLLSDGKIIGNLDDFQIKGKSNLAKSNTSYVIISKQMQVQKAAIKLSRLNVQTLLNMLGEEAFATGKLDLHVQLNDLDPMHLQGSVKLNINKAELNAQLIEKEFGLKIDKTAIEGELKAKLEDTKITYLAKLDSALAYLYSKGKLETDTNRVHSTYNLDIKELGLLKSLMSYSLRGPFSTSGEISGFKDNLEVIGKSDIATSNTSYTANFIELQASKIKLDIKHASLAKLLYMTNQPSYAKATLNAEINIENLDTKKLSGLADIHLINGVLNPSQVKKSFEVSLPKTSFSFDTKAQFKDTGIDYTLDLHSNLAKLTSKGILHPEDFEINSKYEVDIKKLSLLKPLIKTSLYGPFSSRGDINGNKTKLDIKGTSDLAHSATTYKLSLKEFKLNTLELNVKNARLEKLLYLFGEKPYTEGKLALSTKLSSLSPLKGDTKLDITKATVNRSVVRKAFDIKLPYTRIELHSKAKLNNDKISIQSKLDSNLALITMKDTQYTLKDSSIKSDFNIFFPDLQRLESILDKKLYGELRANGDISKNKKLTINAHSDIFDGTLDANIVDDDVKLNFKNLHALKVLHMLGYPKVMDAPVNGTLVYNTKTRKGKLDSYFNKANLTRSKMTDLIKGLTRTDLVKERFSKGSLISLINKDVINSDLKMKSKTVNLESKKFIINSKKRLIDARFSLQVKKHHADILVTQSIDAPKVRLDAKSMITPEIEEKVGKEINRFLKKLF